MAKRCEFYHAKHQPVLLERPKWPILATCAPRKGSSDYWHFYVLYTTKSKVNLFDDWQTNAVRNTHASSEVQRRKYNVCFRWRASSSRKFSSVQKRVFRKKSEKTTVTTWRVILFAPLKIMSTGRYWTYSQVKYWSQDELRWSLSFVVRQGCSKFLY